LKDLEVVPVSGKHNKLQVFGFRFNDFAYLTDMKTVRRMKQRIFMYLFVFTALFVLFQYVTAKRIYEDLNKKLEFSKAQAETFKDSVAVLQDELLEVSHFNLYRNEDDF